MAELILQSLPYARDSSHLLRMLAKLPFTVFLDSGLADQDEARYDILTALPTTHKQLGENEADVNVFELARQLLADSSLPTNHYQPLAHLPFCGGLLGCFAYQALNDHVRHNNTAPITVGSTAARAVFGIYEWAIIVDHQRAETSVFILPQCPAAIREVVIMLVEKLRLPVSDKMPPQINFALQSAFEPLMSKSEYLQAFDRLQHYILAGDCYQANLAMAFAARYQGSSVDAYLLLRERSRSPFSAFIDTGDAAILSLSPERFIAVNNNMVHTQPIKGTRKRVADPLQNQANIDELLSSDKDRAENLMIVDLLRNDLGRVCVTGSVKTESLFELHSFSHVHHLISTISAQLPSACSPLQLLEQCFPGGSITGAPKIRAMQIIAELESVPRSFYCGSVFRVDFLQRMDSNICIRTLVADAQHIYCWGGSGVVADSDAEQEFQECLDKVSVLMDLPQAQ